MSAAEFTIHHNNSAGSPSNISLEDGSLIWTTLQTGKSDLLSRVEVCDSSKLYDEESYGCKACDSDGFTFRFQQRSCDNCSDTLATMGSTVAKELAQGICQPQRIDEILDDIAENNEALDGQDNLSQKMDEDQTIA